MPPKPGAAVLIVVGLLAIAYGVMSLVDGSLTDPVVVFFAALALIIAFVALATAWSNLRSVQNFPRSEKSESSASARMSDQPPEVEATEPPPASNENQ